MHQNALANVERLLDKGVQVVEHAVIVVKYYTIALLWPEKCEVPDAAALPRVRDFAPSAVYNPRYLVCDYKL